MTDFLLLPTVQLKTGDWGAGQRDRKNGFILLHLARIQFFAIFSLASFFPSKQREREGHEKSFSTFFFAARLRGRKPIF